MSPLEGNTHTQKYPLTKQGGAGEMALPETPVPVPEPTEWFTTICNSNPSSGLHGHQTSVWYTNIQVKHP